MEGFMKNVLRAVATMLFFSTTLLAEPNMVSLATCNVGGKRYDAMVSIDEVQKSPSWLKTEEYPPLSPRKAITAAIPVAGSIGGGGKVTGITLQPTFEQMPEKWIYVVSFARGASGNSDGPVELSNVAVLMDGRAVQPKLFNATK
jgi:hypothetical protein